VKFDFVLACLLLGGVSLSPAQGQLGRSVNVQRLVRFSGILTDVPRQLFASGVTVHFAMYNQADGGVASWQETQTVHPDARGGYTVLLGESTLGGLPAEIFVPRGMHWLGVETSGQPEQPRILLVEVPATSKSDPITSDPISSDPSASRSIMPNGPTERAVALVLAIMFLLGIWITCREVLKEWRTPREPDSEPAFPNLARFIPSRDTLLRVTQAIVIPFSKGSRALHTSSPQSPQSTAEDRPNKAA